MAFWVGMGTAVVYGAVLSGLSCFYCYGYTGHWPVYYWPILLCGGVAGVFKGAAAANEYDD